MQETASGLGNCIIHGLSMPGDHDHNGSNFGSKFDIEIILGTFMRMRGEGRTLMHLVGQPLARETEAAYVGHMETHR